jgi:hypothetical protein
MKRTRKQAEAGEKLVAEEAELYSAIGEFIFGFLS